MAWRKLGLVFPVREHQADWHSSHAMMPLALVQKDVIRVYFTARHIDGRSRISFVDLCANDPREILAVNADPILDVGPIGTFDDCGTVGVCVLEVNGKVRMYYNGYNVRNTVPWSNSIGIAESTDGGVTFEKLSMGPFVDRNTVDPYFAISPCILQHEGKWHMWYTSGRGWLSVDGRTEPVYDIRYGSSDDGLSWVRNGEISIPQSTPQECVARASILKVEDTLHMYFTHRGSEDFRDGVDSYRIGYAKGMVGHPAAFKRDDSKVGLAVDDAEYDRTMQAYPNVISTGDKTYLFYNGNGFGADGFCCAVWD